MRSFLIVATMLFLGLNANAQLTFHVVSIPDNTPPEDNIYIAGNFQGWDPGNANYSLTDNGNDTYSITISPSAGFLEFKFTRGSWTNVEGDEEGNFRPNRTFQYNGVMDSVEITILGWEDLGSGGQSTAAANVFILDSSFYMPELDRHRRVWIYLPPDYDTTQKQYPVLYMHDGQNIFDAVTSFSGEWEVDESLNQLFDDGDYGCIVVAIDNGGVLRLNEYSPWVNPNYGGGEGDDYVDFIVQTLKPHVDSHYRTLSGRDYTGLMGSSMGGLISLYGGIEYQDVFSRIGSFSPAYWFSEESYAHVITSGKTFPMQIYTIVGSMEGSDFVNSVLEMQDSLYEAGFEDHELEQLVHVDGQHSEWYWRREFQAAYQWLFGDLDLSGIQQMEPSGIKIYPNPANSVIRIQGLEGRPNTFIRLTCMDGKRVSIEVISSVEIPLGEFPAGKYLLEIIQSNKVIHKQGLIISR